MSTPSLAQLQQAITIAEKIEKLQAELASLVGGSSSTPTAFTASPAKKKGKRTMSPETIAKMRASQQARWAKKKGTSVSPATVAAPKSDAKPSAGPKKKKGGLSPEGRARIVAALKARHAAKRAAAQ